MRGFIKSGQQSGQIKSRRAPQLTPAFSMPSQSYSSISQQQ